MARVLVLATTTGYQTHGFGDAAGGLGVDLVLATDRCHVLEDPWRDGAIPVRFHDEPASVAAILAAAADRPIDGGLVVGGPPAPAALAPNKQLACERLRDQGLPVPWFMTARLGAEMPPLAAPISFPCV